MTYLTNIDSFSKQGTLGLLPTKPIHVKLKSNAKPSHGCAFSVPKAYKSMICNKLTTFAASMSFASATKVNRPHLLLELPRKMVRLNSSQTFAN
jgi:hypothetical protein